MPSVAGLLFLLALFVPGKLVPELLLTQDTVPTIALAPPNFTAREPLTMVRTVVELAEKRLLAFDERERRLVVIHLDDASVHNFSRVGSGPGEFRAIGAMLPRPRGGVWLTDFVLRRLLPVKNDLTFDTPLALPTSMTIRGVDGAGRLYGDAHLPNLRESRNDSMYIVRWDPVAARVDTLMKYDAGVTKWTGRSGQAMAAFPAIDTWVVLPDGRLWIIGAAPYRITTYRDGAKLASISVARTPIPVTAADREAYLARRAATPPRRMGQGSATNAAPSIAWTFPDVLPAFGGDGGGAIYAMASPQGHVWVRRLLSERVAEPLYDVLDAASGALVARVRLAPKHRVVGFGARGVYTTRADDDDLLLVQRHPYPAIAARR